MIHKKKHHKTVLKQALHHTLTAVQHATEGKQKEAHAHLKSAYEELGHPIPTVAEFKVKVLTIASYVTENEESLSHLSIEIVKLVEEHAL